MDEANIGARLPSKSDEIPNCKQPLSHSTKRRRTSATSSCNASTPKKKVRIGSKDQFNLSRSLLSSPSSRRQRQQRVGDRTGRPTPRSMALAKDKDALGVILGLADRCFLAANAACH